MNEKTHQNPKHYSCSPCRIETNNKKDFNKHLLTPKHLNRTCVEPINPANIYTCKICNKNYKARNSLWYHEQKCIYSLNVQTPVINEPPIIEDNTIIKILINENKELINENKELINDNKEFKNLIMEMMKSNTDLQKQMMEMCKNSNNTTINNNKNSHNKTFNMQIFLNEHCKDAMNIKDFADSFQLQISDFEKVGHLGYVDGISDIIIKKLNELDVCKRPIHCSDTKRDTMYVHADNVWIKENSDHEQVRLLVQRITAKNIRLIPIWQDLYPNSRNNMHKLNDTYMSLTRQAMGGFGGTIPENETKIIKKIAKTVFIDKHM